MVEMSFLDPSGGASGGGLMQFQMRNETFLLARIRELGLDLVRVFADTGHGAQLAAIDLTNQFKMCCRFLTNIYVWLSTFFRARLLEVIRWVLPERAANALAGFLERAASVVAGAGALATEASPFAGAYLALVEVVDLPVVLGPLRTIAQAIATGIAAGSASVCMPAVALSVICLWFFHRRGRGDRVLQAEMREREANTRLAAAEIRIREVETREREAEARARAAEARATALEAERDSDIDQSNPWTATRLRSRRSRSQLQDS